MPKPFFDSKGSERVTAAAPATSVAAAASQPLGAAAAPSTAPAGESAPDVSPTFVTLSPLLAPAPAPGAPVAPRERRTADGVFLVELDSVSLLRDKGS